MCTSTSILDEVNEALQVNQEIQGRLKQNCRRLSELINRMADLLEALCRSQHSAKLRRQLSHKRRRSSSLPSSPSPSPSPTVHYLKTHIRSKVGVCPFHDAGIFAESGIPRYAKIPLTKDEARWQEATLAFPQLQRERYVRASRESPVEVNGLRKKEEHALVEAVRGYSGKPCGESFWKALAPNCKSRFHIASRYVALQARKNTVLRTAGETLRPLSDLDRFCAMREAARGHMGDLGEMFAVYAENLVTSARCRVHLAEAEGTPSMSIPPYLWETRRNFQRMIEPIIRESQSCAAPPEDVEELDDVPLLEWYKSRARDMPSLVDLTACLLALKGGALGENTTLSDVKRVFLSNHGGVSISTKDLMELRL